MKKKINSLVNSQRYTNHQIKEANGIPLFHGFHCFYALLNGIIFEAF